MNEILKEKVEVIEAEKNQLKNLLASATIQDDFFWGENTTSNLKCKFVARSIEIHAVWRSANELFAHVHAPNINFNGSGSHHFTGPFRIVMDVYDTFETREHCSQSLWRWYYRSPDAERLELVKEAHMVLRNYIRKRSFLLSSVLGARSSFTQIWGRISNNF